jgi:tetratricopeptide (TPR) repeat protein
MSTAQAVAPEADAGETTNDAARLIGEKKPAEAIEMLDRIIAAQTAKHRGETRQLYCASSPEESLAYLVTAASESKEAVVVDGQYCMAIFLKGFALIDLDRGDEARPFLEQAVAMAPMNSQFLSELGEWHKGRRAWEPAFALFEKALDAAAISPAEFQNRRRGRSLRGMGFIRIEQGRLDEAEALFRKCLEIDPNDEKAKAELRYIGEQRARLRARAS